MDKNKSADINYRAALEDINILSNDKYVKSFRELAESVKENIKDKNDVFAIQMEQINELTRRKELLTERLKWITKEHEVLTARQKTIEEFKAKYSKEKDNQFSEFEKTLNNLFEKFLAVPGIKIATADNLTGIKMDVLNEMYRETADKTPLRVSFLVAFDPTERNSATINLNARVSVTITHNFVNPPELISSFSPRAFSCSIEEIQAYFSAVSYYVHNITRQSSSTYEQSMLSEQTFNDSLFAH